MTLAQREWGQRQIDNPSKWGTGPSRPLCLWVYLASCCGDTGLTSMVPLLSLPWLHLAKVPRISLALHSPVSTLHYVTINSLTLSDSAFPVWLLCTKWNVPCDWQIYRLCVMELYGSLSWLYYQSWWHLATPSFGACCILQTTNHQIM